MGKVILERQEEDVAYIPGTQNLAGSASTLSQCVLNVLGWFNLPFEKAIRWGAEHPRSLIGMSKTPGLDERGERVEWKKLKGQWEIQHVRLG